MPFLRLLVTHLLAAVGTRSLLLELPPFTAVKYVVESHTGVYPPVALRRSPSGLPDGRPGHKWLHMLSSTTRRVFESLP